MSYLEFTVLLYLIISYSILFETPPEILDNHALTMFEVLFGFLDSKQFEELMKYLNIE